MSRLLLEFALTGCVALMVPASLASGQWVTFSNETSSRIIASPDVGVSDNQEKDYAWGDFDQDGDTDLVVARKSPFTSIGRRRNVLFMNEGLADGQSIDGVLVDRTAQYASAADDGGQGMLDLTDDRDIIVTDVNGDGWLDIVTATTYGQGLAKSISHPRVYINLAEDKGQWLGFKYEEARIPQFPSHPNFCGVGAGDVTGNKLPDLYFVDYDNMQPNSFEDRLLINDGNGFFTDQSATRMTTTMLSSSFGTTAHIADMNGDGKLDVIKSENGPIKTHYNNGGGFFTNMQATYNGAAYNSSVGDLNGDGKMDIIVSDDGSDRYLLNSGNGANGQANFSQLIFPDSGGFNGNSHYADLNNDGHTDVVICDVDVDAPGCSRVSRIFRNNGNVPNVTMTNQATGISTASLTGVHDVAILDVNRDGWLDLVIGRCSGTQIFMNQPPQNLVFSYPQGLPAFVNSGEDFHFQVQVSSLGTLTPVNGTGKLHYSINGAPYVEVPMTSLGSNLYEAVIPETQCTDIIDYWFTAQASNNLEYREPPNAPNVPYTAVSAAGTTITSDDGLEGDTSGWSVTNHPSLTGGGWQVADPNGTINFGSLASPEDDAGAGDHVLAFITQNGLPGGPANAADVDGGPTWLVSPVIDLAGTDATISYERWFYCEDQNTAESDFLVTEISNNNGVTWVPVHSTGTTNSTWESVNFRVGQFVEPTNQVRLRFFTSDSPNNSITEAGIDNLTVEELICDVPDPCPADITNDQSVNVDDLLAVINTWGACSGCASDINGDNVVNVDDLLSVINAWGPCE